MCGGLPTYFSWGGNQVIDLSVLSTRREATSLRLASRILDGTAAFRIVCPQVVPTKSCKAEGSGDTTTDGCVIVSLGWCSPDVSELFQFFSSFLAPDRGGTRLPRILERGFLMRVAVVVQRRFAQCETPCHHLADGYDRRENTEDSRRGDADQQQLRCRRCMRRALANLQEGGNILRHARDLSQQHHLSLTALALSLTTYS
jgi:hypothetical protein